MRLSTRLIFVHSFFSNEYEEINFQTNSQFESMFIGTAHTDRYLISEKVKIMVIVIISLFCVLLFT